MRDLQLHQSSRNCRSLASPSCRKLCSRLLGMTISWACTSTRLKPRPFNPPAILNEKLAATDQLRRSAQEDRSIPAHRLRAARGLNQYG